MILREKEGRSESIIKGVAFVFVCGREVLLQKRNKDISDDFSGYLIIPGGGIEPEETACNALVREVKEELSYKIDINSQAELLGCVDYEFKGKRELHVFLIPIKDKSEVKLNLDASGKMYWEDFDKAYKKLSLSVTKDILDVARKRLNF